jgi:hypothetical protein
MKVCLKEMLKRVFSREPAGNAFTLKVESEEYLIEKISQLYREIKAEVEK